MEGDQPATARKSDNDLFLATLLDRLNRSSAGRRFAGRL